MRAAPDRRARLNQGMLAGVEPWAAEAIRVAAGILVGMLVGFERGFTLRGQHDGKRVAGIRTFTLMGLASGIAGLIAERQPLAAGAIVAGLVVMLAIAYVPSLRERGDATSPVAAVATIAAALLAGLGNVGLALAATAVIVFVLALKKDLHRFVGRLDERDIKSLARFAIIALAVLPFLPDRFMGPYSAWNPAKLWWVVVLVTGFSFAGYIANRLFGAKHGTIVTALIGGAYSSTAVTQSLAQRLGAGGGSAAPAGIALASAVMYLRVIILVAVLAPRFWVPFAIDVAPALFVAWIAGWWLYRRADKGGESMSPGNPIAIVPALGFLVFVALAAIAARWAQGRFGESGIALLLLTMGSMDVDAAIVTAGGLPPQAIAAPLAAIAIGGTIVANMAVKIGITLAYARSKGRGAALALAASAAVLAITLAIAYARLTYA